MDYFEEKFYASKRLRAALILAPAFILSMIIWLLTKELYVAGFVLVISLSSLVTIIHNQMSRIKRKKDGNNEKEYWRSFSFVDSQILIPTVPNETYAVTFPHCKDSLFRYHSIRLQALSNNPWEYHEGILMGIAYAITARYQEITPSIPRNIEYSIKKFLNFTVWRDRVVLYRENETDEPIFLYEDLFVEASKNLFELLKTYNQWRADNPKAKPFSKNDECFWAMLGFVGTILHAKLQNSRPFSSETSEESDQNEKTEDKNQE